MVRGSSYRVISRRTTSRRGPRTTPAIQRRVRMAAPSDLEELVSLRAALWPDAPKEEHRAEVRAILDGNPRSTLPLVLIVAELEAELAGLVQTALSSHTDHCDY